ncbi:MAG: PT domain-containing protein, partial [Spirochaetales bacterium]|nr:PT domain-containing protein [Spirochaetales bacterium]
MRKRVTVLFIAVMMILSFSAIAQSYEPISTDFSYDGAGTFYWEVKCVGDHINSWNMKSLTINGLDITNKWISGKDLPSAVNGVYRVVYQGDYPWSHVEIMGKCSVTEPTPEQSTPTPAPTATIEVGATMVLVSPETQSVEQGNNFNVSINVEPATSDITVAAYGFTLNFDSSIIKPVTSIGQYGVEAGSEGFLAAANLSGNTLTMSGFDVNGVSGSSIEMLNITFSAISEGTSSLELSVDNLTDVTAAEVSSGSKNGTVIVTNGTEPTPEITPYITPTPEVSGSDTKLYISPANQILSHPVKADVSVMADVAGQNLAAYGIIVTFDSSIIKPDESIGQFGVEAGADGFLAAANLSNNVLTISGFDINGIGPADNLELVTISFNSTGTSGQSAINIAIDNLTDSSAAPVFGQTSDGSITIDNGSVSLAILDMAVSPASQTVTDPASVSVDIMADIQGAALASYSVFVDFDTAILDVENAGIKAGADGYLSAANISGNRIKIAGFDVNGIGPADDQELLTITFQTKGVAGTSTITLISDLATDTSTNSFITTVHNGSITVEADTETETPENTPVITPEPSDCEVITPNFSFDGAGSFCLEVSCISSYINSWNLRSLTINGKDITNIWIAAKDLPAKVNGVYKLEYVGSYPWSHVEIFGNDCSQPTEQPTVAPTAEPTIVPTEGPTAEPTGEPADVVLYVSPVSQSITAPADV